MAPTSVGDSAGALPGAGAGTAGKTLPPKQAKSPPEKSDGAPTADVDASDTKTPSDAETPAPQQGISPPKKPPPTVHHPQQKMLISDIKAPSDAVPTKPPATAGKRPTETDPGKKRKPKRARTGPSQQQVRALLATGPAPRQWTGLAAGYCAQRHADGWERRLMELQRFKQSHEGDCNDVPLGYRDPDDLTLGEWADKQRKMFREGKLDVHRKGCLDAMGFDFSFKREVVTGDEHFDQKLRELAKYKEQHGSCDVPDNYCDERETLGQWAKRMRQLYNEGALEEEKHRVLCKRGFVFEPDTNVTNTIVGKAFMKNYQELVQFKRDHGHLIVPSDYRASAASNLLAKWIGKQKARFRDKELSRNHTRLLEEIGLDLSKRKERGGARSTEKWETKFNALAAFREVHGHCNVTIKEEKKLASWMGNQRQMFRDGKLSEDRTHRLLGIGFNFDPRNKMGSEVTAKYAASTDSVFNSDAWTESYNALKSFTETNGHAEVPPEYEDDNIEGNLHIWVENQRRFFREGKLPQSNADMLVELGVDLSQTKTDYKAPSAEVMWMKYYEALKQFPVDKAGYVQIPPDFTVDNGKGGRRNLKDWLEKQKESYRAKSKRITPEKVSLFESLGIDIGNVKVYHRKTFSLGEMPDDDLWFRHKEGKWKRVPADWKFPTVSFEEAYVLYHCGPKDGNTSPIKMFMPWDMERKPSRAHTDRGELANICEIVDRECERQGIVFNGVMTEEEARRCARAGVSALNVDACRTDDNVLQMSWRSVYSSRRWENTNYPTEPCAASGANEGEGVVKEKQSQREGEAGEAQKATDEQEDYV